LTNVNLTSEDKVIEVPGSLREESRQQDEQTEQSLAGETSQHPSRPTEKTTAANSDETFTVDEFREAFKKLKVANREITKQEANVTALADALVEEDNLVEAMREIRRSKDAVRRDNTSPHHAQQQAANQRPRQNDALTFNLTEILSCFAAGREEFWKQIMGAYNGDRGSHPQFGGQVSTIQRQELRYFTKEICALRMSRSRAESARENRYSLQYRRDPGVAEDNVYDWTAPSHQAAQWNVGVQTEVVDMVDWWRGAFEPAGQEEAQPAETQPEEAQPAEAQPAEAQPEEAQPAEAQPEEAQLEEAQLDISHPEALVEPSDGRVTPNRPALPSLLAPIRRGRDGNMTIARD
tara:strand:- start:16814 stop:17863 length:1050 start_codon:yes stop_codon:yes gene_type:complete